MNSSILTHLNQLPPNVCWLIARDPSSRGTPITLAQISERSGLSLRRVAWIACNKSWNRIPIADTDAFMLGCGITMKNFWRHLAYIRRTYRHPYPLAHLHRLPLRTRRSILKTLEK